MITDKMITFFMFIFEIRLARNSQQSSCLSLPNAEITGMELPCLVLIFLILCRKWDKNHFWQRNAANINSKLTQKSSAGFQGSALGNESWLGSRVTHSRQRSFGTVQRGRAHQYGQESQRAVPQGGAPCPFLNAHPDTDWPCWWTEGV